MARSSKPEVSDDSVKAKTGRVWSEWFDILDKAGAQDWDHKTIVKHLADHYSVPGWWRQTVTVGYERARGQRAVHETPSGFSASKSKTIAASVETLFQFWVDGRKRKRWIDDRMDYSTVRLNKTLRFKWGKNNERVSVGFVAKSAEKTAVTIQHSKLKNATAVGRAKSFWTDRLTALAALVE